MTSEMRNMLEGFGYDSHTARLIATQAHKNNLTIADVAAWIAEATYSGTIRNPRGFVRAAITRGDKPPAPEASRSRHFPNANYLTDHFCPDCQARPCVCDWDPAIETLSEFRYRTAPEIGGTT